MGYGVAMLIDNNQKLSVGSGVRVTIILIDAKIGLFKWLHMLHVVTLREI